MAGKTEVPVKEPDSLGGASGPEGKMMDLAGSISSWGVDEQCPAAIREMAPQLKRKETGSDVQSSLPSGSQSCEISREA